MSSIFFLPVSNKVVLEFGFIAFEKLTMEKEENEEEDDDDDDGKIND